MGERRTGITVFFVPGRRNRRKSSPAAAKDGNFYNNNNNKNNNGIFSPSSSSLPLRQQSGACLLTRSRDLRRTILPPSVAIRRLLAYLPARASTSPLQRHGKNRREIYPTARLISRPAGFNVARHQRNARVVEKERCGAEGTYGY